MRLNGADDGIDRRFSFWTAARRQVASVAKAVVAVEPLRSTMLAFQRLVRAAINGNARSAKLRRIEGVSRGLLDGHIARHGGNRRNVNLRMAQRHDQRDGVVGSCVGVN